MIGLIVLIFHRTEEDLCSSQSSWCSETCQELDVGSDKTNSTTNNTKPKDFMSEEWIVFLRQSASEVKFKLLSVFIFYTTYK